MMAWSELHPYIQRRVQEKAKHRQIAEELQALHPDAPFFITEATVRQQASIAGALSKTAMDGNMLQILREMKSAGAGNPEIIRKIEEVTGKTVTLRTLQCNAEKLGLAPEKISWKQHGGLLDAELASGKTHAQIAQSITGATGIAVTEGAINCQASIRGARRHVSWTPSMELDLFLLKLKEKNYGCIARQLNEKYGTGMTAYAAKRKFERLPKGRRRRMLGQAKRRLVRNGGALFWDEAKDFMLRHGTLQAEHLEGRGRHDLIHAKKVLGGREKVLAELGRRVTRLERTSILSRVIERAVRDARLSRVYAELAAERFGLGGREPKTLEAVGSKIASRGVELGKRFAGVKKRTSYETRATLAENRLLQALGRLPYVQDMRFFLGPVREAMPNGRSNGGVGLDEFFDELRGNRGFIDFMRAGLRENHAPVN